MRIRDWSSDVCSSDLRHFHHGLPRSAADGRTAGADLPDHQAVSGEHGAGGHQPGPVLREQRPHELRDRRSLFAAFSEDCAEPFEFIQRDGFRQLPGSRVPQPEHDPALSVVLATYRQRAGDGSWISKSAVYSADRKSVVEGKWGSVSVDSG